MRQRWRYRAGISKTRSYILFATRKPCCGICKGQKRNCLSHTVTERMDGMKNVQISQELFMQLLRFHLMEDVDCETEIKRELEKKLDKMVMRDLYGKFKTAPTEEEREQARKEYLDRRGAPESFRW